MLHGRVSVSTSTVPAAGSRSRLLRAAMSMLGASSPLEGASETRTIVLRQLFKEPCNIAVEEAVGGHGGGDNILLQDLFGEPVTDENMRAASHIDGAASILTGIAANRSISTGQVVKVDDILKLP